MKKELVHIVHRCKKQDREAQKELYDRYSPLFFSIALRYMKHYQEAEDILVTAFYKIFSKIDDFKDEGSFEGWMKRIVVNEALMQIRKNKNLHLTVEISEIDVPEDSNIVDDLQYEELVSLLEELPTGYRTVFNLYVIEGYKHREVAEELGISINTSKSQLILAKKRIREIIKKKDKSNIAS